MKKTCCNHNDFETRSAKMKMKHIAGMFTLALAAFAAPLTTFAVADGDIYEIVPIEGSCTPGTALTSGKSFTFAVRLMARDDTDPRQWKFEYNTLFGDKDLALTLYPPSIGVVVGGRLVNAQYLLAVPSTTKMYTDLYFTYQVRPGDIAFPAKLALEGSTTDNPIYADSDVGLSSTTPYCQPQSMIWSLEDELGNKAKLLWGSDSTRTALTKYELGGLARTYDYTLELADFHVKSIRLGELDDEDQEGDDLWQVNEGSTKPFPVTTVGVPENAVTLYAWAIDEDAVKVKGPAASVTLPDSSVVTRQMYTFTVTTGVTDYAIPVTGVASNKSGKVVLSPKPDYTYDAAGALVTNFITRTVKCIEALPPSVSAVFAGDKVVASVTASTNDTQDVYETDAVPVTISLTEPFGVATNITLSFTLVDSPAADVFASNYVGVAVNNTAFSKPPVVTNVFFAADSTEATVYVYPMGGDTLTYSGGIHIEPVLPSGTPFDKYTPAGCTLRIKDATPAVVSPTASSAPFAGTVKEGCDIDIEIRDCYRDQNVPQTFDLEVNFSDGGTFKTNGVAFARGVAKTVTVKGFGSSTTWATIKVTDRQGNSSTSEQVPIIVVAAKTVFAELVNAPSDTAAAETELVFPEGDSRWVRFKVNQTSGADMYAFLVPLNEASSNLVTAAQVEKGALVAAEETASKVLPTTSMSFLDGCAAAGDLQFDVQLRTGPTTNDTLVTAYGSQKLYISVTNVPPYLKAAQFNGSPVSSGGTVTAYSGTDVKLKATAADASLVDLRATNDNERVVMRWMYSDGPAGEESWTTVFTTNAEKEVSAEISAVFNAEGTTQTVEIRAADKDMLAAALNDLDAVDWDAAPAFRYSVKVNPSPSVTVLDDGGNDMASYFPTYTEMNNGSSSPYVTVKLSPAPNGVTADDPLTVQLVLTKNGDGNARLSTTNLATFTGGKATSARVYLYDLDGAYDSSFTISAAVVTTNKTSSGTRWCDYYAKGEGTFRVLNVSPEITGIAGVNTSVTNKTTLGATVSMSATVKDISADLAATNKFSVTWYDEGGIPNKSKSLSYTVGGVGITNNVVAAWDLKPSVEGYFSIRVVADDGDGSDPAEKEIWFYVEPSKQLQLSPYHPVATTDTRYKKAKGAGTGRVWANGVRVTASDFVHTWYYNVKTSTANVYAWGYPGTTNATGYADNGKLGQMYGTEYRDIAITPSGATSSTPLTDEQCYKYASPYDNFFYTWAYVTPSETGGSPAIEYGNPKPTLSPTATASGAITLDEYQNEKESYAVRMMEAVFSREYRLVDNLGDINADGVPDVLAVKYGFDAYDSEGAIVGDDVASLKDYNSDEDFLPAASQISQAALVPGANSDWSGGQKFSAPLEVRGFHEGLNYGMFRFDEDERAGWVSELDMSKAEIAALTRHVQANGGWNTNEFDNLMTDHDVMTNAMAYIAWTWRNFGGDSADSSTWGFTVENRTDPTIDDTDGDGIPDGYEYYFWYAATVGFDEDGKPITGSKFNLQDVESPTKIESADIAAIFNPNASRDWTKQDTDGDGLLDTEEILIGTNPVQWDTDGDKLSDLYEVIYGIDPLHNNAKGNNGAFNGDGDFMAKANLGTYSIYTIGGRLIAVSQIASLSLNDPGPGTNTMTVIGFPVYAFNGGYMPTTERFSESASQIAYRFTYLTGDEPDPPTGNVSLYHYQVYNYYGFDPRTGWYRSNDGSVSKVKRWFKKGNPRSAGMAQNTEEFSALDEFRLIKYRYLMGLANYSKDASDIANAEDPLQKLADVIVARSTNPNAALESRTYGSKTYSDTVHGADTDQDGVPDGWELYIGVNPNVQFTDTNEGLYNVIRTLDADDGLALDEEFAGTDSCGAYDGCETIFANHPSQEGNATMHGWYNKFFPTDPRSDDTDGDGIDDGKEGQSWDGVLVFNRWGQAKYGTVEGDAVKVNHIAIYGSPEPGILRCVPGGGLNPCSIDTDMDGLPDPWERQYAGLLFEGDDLADGVLSGVSALDPEVYDDIREAAFAFNSGSSTNDSSFYVCMGMDPTVFDSNSNEELRDKDWDGDGLENWQEYLVQSLRHLRYDDCINPLNGYDMPTPVGDGTTVAAFRGANGYLAVDLNGGYSEKELQIIKDTLGYASFADFASANPGYLAALGYFADPPRDWDPMHIDFGYKYMMKPQALQQLKTTRQVNDSTNELGHVIWTGTKYTYEYNWFTGEASIVLSTEPPITYTNDTDNVDADVAFTLVSVTNALLTVRTETATNNYYLTTTSAPEASFSDEWLKASSYVSTDPRLWDTDADGMDDFYELFHGLNPILGSAGTLSVSERATMFGVVEVASVENANDVIASSYGTGINVYRNGYVGWSNTEVPGYDPIRYPWLMGVGACDADGDGLRNEEEALLVNLATPNATHTDPTPLWMTDSTVESDQVPVVGSMAFTNTIVISEVTFPDGTVYELPTDQWIVWRDVAEVATTNSWVTTYRSPSYTAQYYHSEWSGPDQDPTNEENDGKYGWATSYPYTFELNEGYDTDSDWKADRTELQSVVEPTSDPQDFADPSRRQSLTFGDGNGEGVAISVTPATRENYTSNADFLKQFTVEAWMKPKAAATGNAQYVVSRALNYEGWDLSNAVDVVRNNFALGITAQGKAFAEFDDSTDGRVHVEGSTLADGIWAHVAATFDGVELKIYVNGSEIASKPTTLAPANGVTQILQDPQTAVSAYFPVVSYLSTPAATVLGGRATSASTFSAGGIARAASWATIATDFYKGSLDEVRVWDGARSPEQIQADFKKRYDVDKIKEMRMSTYNEYAGGARRNDSMSDEYGSTLSPELVQHYSFCALAGATEAQYVQKLPAGFEDNVAAMVNDDVGRDAVKVAWWNSVVTNPLMAASQVYSSGYSVPWIHNTVGHLPRLSGNVEDSVFWNENLAGYTPASFQGLSKFSFRNEMNPYNLVQGFGVDSLTSLKFTLLRNADANAYGELRERFRYDIRRGFSGTTDLVPVGDVYAKRLSGSWDDEGPEDAWAVTTDGAADDGDPDDTGIPKWALAAGYTTAEAYARALAQGLLPDGSIDAAYAGAADLNSNGLPDWWEKIYNLDGYGAHDDPDHDGLSVWQEYLISQGASYGQGVGANNWPSNLNPRASITDESKGKVRDYFRAGGDGSTDMYVGEIVGDHDFMEDWWERSQGSSYASTAVYDPYSDADGDGWSSWAECRYSLFTALINANAISHSVGGYEVKDMPVPTIRLTLAYDGVQNVAGAPLVLQTFTEPGAARSDATFLLNVSATNEYSRFIGMWGERTVRGTLTPGHIDQNSLSFWFLGIDRNDDYSWYLWNESLTRPILYHGTYEDFIAAQNEYGMYGWTYYNSSANTSRAGRVELLSSTGTWVNFDDGDADISVTTDDEGRKGYICALGERLGTIDLVTGDYSIDLTTLGSMHVGSGGSNTVNISSSLIRMSYCAAMPNVGANRLDVSLGDADEGYVKEGKNTIVAFYDLDGNGAYTAGEPFGTISGVDVGWYRTERTVIELTDTSAVMPRITLGSLAADRKAVDGDAGRVTISSSGSGESAAPAAAAQAASAANGGDAASSESGALRSTYRIVRTAINGEKTTSRPTLATRTLAVSGRSYLHEGDVLGLGRLGLDWGTLGVVAERMGLSAEDIGTVTYALEEMSADTNGTMVATELLTFVNTYNALRGKATPVSPVGGDIVRGARPELRWTSNDDTMTAFRLQLRVEDGDVVYDSGDRLLPGRVGGEYAFSPELYVGFAATNGASVFKDGTNYQWRVALMNAKFSEADESAYTEWSDATFAYSVVPADESLTDFGKVAAAVRYYGPATFDATNVVVEAYDTPDFSGAPLARVRLADKTLVTNRADIATTNALFVGVKPGDVYLLAFIDRNNNGVRDRYETWGYANQVDVYTANIYSPVPVTVQEEAVRPGSATIYMEDTDVNRNGVLDCKEDVSELSDSSDSALDSDGDGLSDVEEETLYSTDPLNPDTDGDGMPDGWEAMFAGTDPLVADADYAVDGDVMAYYEEAGTLVTVWDGTNVASCATYLLSPDADRKPVNGDDASALELFSAWDLGDGVVGYGASVAPQAGMVYEVADVTAAYVHSQVFEMLGFDPNTANGSVPAEQQVNTRPFTALDKYLVVRYLEARGVTNFNEVAMNTNRTWASSTVKPGDVDYDRDGMPDGWEFYTMFGPDSAGDLVTISPWDATDRTGDADGDGLANVYEYDGGVDSTDPWSADSDGDGVDDKASHDYFFKTVDGDEAGKTGYRGDADNDQLSNLIEYMVQGLTNFPDVVASKMSTFDETEGQLVPDYFLPHGLLYLGEMFTDHDMIEDWWEDEQPAETRVGAERVANYSRYSYDAASDSDGDGWSNWAEARLAIANGDAAAADKPTPVIETAIRYNGDLSRIASDDTLVVMAWSAKKSTVGECDAAWTMPAGDLANGLVKVNLAEPSFGALLEGENTFVAYIVGGDDKDDKNKKDDADDAAVPAFAVGKPYGVATGVRVSYLRGTPFTLELTDQSASVVRVDIVAALEAQATYAGALVEEIDSATAEANRAAKKGCFDAVCTEATDRGGVYGDERWAGLLCPQFIGTNATIETPNVTVRILRSDINGEPAGGRHASGVLWERKLSISRHGVLTEADLLDDLSASGGRDLDWGGPTNAYTGSSWANVTSATYRIVVFEGTVDSFKMNNNLAVAFVNKFEIGPRQTAVSNKVVSTSGGQPTFSWTHENTIGKPYPAFQLKVWKTGGTTLVYDSGVQRAPARDADGVYRWTAPLWAGSITPQGEVFEADEDYVWDVSMLDAKFTAFNGSAAKGAALRVSDTAGDALLSDYGSIAVAVKYMGPGAVSTNGMRHVVRVEAYDSPDFSGMPVAAGYVMNTNTMAATDKIALNALVKGLPKGGEYYVLAYLDSNGDGVRQAWESWGYGCYVGDPDRRDVYTPRAYGVAMDAAGDLVTPTCVVYLEDADTNGNKLPDSLEVDAATGEFTGTNVTAVSSPYIVTVGTNGVIAATNIFAAIEKDIVALPYYSALVEMENGGSMASASLALAMSGVNLAALSVEPRVAITDFDPTVGISVEIDPGAKIDHETLVVSEVTVSVELNVTVEYTTSLAAAWTPIATVPVTLSSISGVTSFAATDPAMFGINSAIKTTATSYPSAFFRIKEVKAVHK